MVSSTAVLSALATKNLLSVRLTLHVARLRQNWLLGVVSYGEEPDFKIPEMVSLEIVGQILLRLLLVSKRNAWSMTALRDHSV
jgi:hypothetical protein